MASSVGAAKTPVTAEAARRRELIETMVIQLTEIKVNASNSSWF
jgi:hypothetical protein